MAQFIVRIELHDASAEDYKKLDSAMQAGHFHRTITSDDGTIYALPTAQYLCAFDGPASAVRDIAVATAAVARKRFEVLVAQSEDITWQGLAML